MAYAVVGVFVYIGLDKVLHFLVGFGAAFLMNLYGHPKLGFTISVGLGAGKEWYDAKHPDKHTADKWDFVATVLGGAVGASIKVQW